MMQIRAPRLPIPGPQSPEDWTCPDPWTVAGERVSTKAGQVHIFRFHRRKVTNLVTLPKRFRNLPRCDKRGRGAPHVPAPRQSGALPRVQRPPTLERASAGRDQRRSEERPLYTEKLRVAGLDSRAHRRERQDMSI